MPFYPPEWVPKLPFDPPDSITVADFLLEEHYGRHPLGYSNAPFICGLTGKSYSTLEVKERVDYLARGLAKELGWEPNKGSEWDKVIAVFSVNTLDTIPLAWATHRLGGLQSPANAAYSAAELEYQLKNSGAKALFTCLPLLSTAKEAAKNAGIPENRIYILEVPKFAVPAGVTSNAKTVDDFIREGAQLPRLEPLNWKQGDGAKKTAFLCYSSGTSGLPKGVMISHRNVIANTLQISTFEQPDRDRKRPAGTQSDYTENVLGLLPMSHIYGLVVVAHSSIYRGYGVVVLPKFDFALMLKAIQDNKISTLFLVPPIIILLTKNKEVLSKYDLSNVTAIFTGAAPLGKETAADLQSIFPNWAIRQGYGLTETCTVVTSTAADDIWFGSSGSILPSIECKIVTPEGEEITGYDQPGELLVKSPAVVLGYLKNDKANKETFQDGFMRTGDEAVIRKAPSGVEHLFITDRIKELIKVKGHQVAPAELEAHLLTHPAVNDCAVIQVPDDAAGEVPKAFVVKAPSVGLEENDRVLARSIQKHVEEHKAKYKWITGGVEFINEIPKSPSVTKRNQKMAIANPAEHRDDDMDVEEEEVMLDPAEAGEEVPDDEDAPMESDDEDGQDGDQGMQVEIELQNDSVAHFDGHQDSIFCIAQHPVHPSIVATGGGDDTGYVVDVSDIPAGGNVANVEREGLKSLFKLEGHSDSINAITFSYPKGQYVATAGLDGKLRVWQGEPAGKRWKFLAEAQEVEEINWLLPCPDPEHPNVVALGANDGSVWVYQLDASQKDSPLTAIQAFYLHTESCTAGSWSPDGKFLATVSEDSSFYVWDVFGDAAAAGLTSTSNAQSVVGLTGLDERFRVEGGLYSVAVAPNGSFAAVGGPEGQVRIVGLPRITPSAEAGSSAGGGARNKAGGAKQAAAKGAAGSAGQAGQILASLQAGSDNVETLSFSSPPLTLLAAGNVDGSITLFDTAHRFAIRRRIEEAHADEDAPQAVVKVEFVKREGPGSALLRSVGYDGVLRSWDARGGTAAAAKGLVGEWRGHRGGGEGGGIMSFVQGNGDVVVTAGDDKVALVFPTPVA
ncbi:acetyl-CoA synthetase-like protein [Aaosphaeria arxii CBS 175.79]|uniref:Acetyl-CoA synthetase-like protein n=1 Tax=Aaosphaeria arxii CBS 175.79 TaxID=1450172 RepID=A0A6A5XRX6_9PLEO|nr:acetyl-CoA synthetase-like protein [Aaosphaeria arxii CBS 175.79]KAF2015659.1 acetyl-CoA synthetase-like protein [Aaosphaeria arxii CBS 175.79]